MTNDTRKNEIEKMKRIKKTILASFVSVSLGFGASTIEAEAIDKTVLLNTPTTTEDTFNPTNYIASTPYNVFSSSFSDVSTNSWAFPYIFALSEAKYINGYSDGTFRPSNSITRAEFVKIMVNCLGLDLSNDGSIFTDVPNNAWYKNFVITAFNLGLINGVGENKFEPEVNISRQDTAVVLNNALKLFSAEKSVDKNIKFIDEKEISSYAKEAVENCVNAGIFTGNPDGTFAPKKPITRAEATAIMQKLMQKILNENLQKPPVSDPVYTEWEEKVSYELLPCNDVTRRFKRAEDEFNSVALVLTPETSEFSGVYLPEESAMKIFAAMQYVDENFNPLTFDEMVEQNRLVYDKKKILESDGTLADYMICSVDMITVYRTKYIYEERSLIMNNSLKEEKNEQKSICAVLSLKKEIETAKKS